MANSTLKLGQYDGEILFSTSGTSGSSFNPGTGYGSVFYGSDRKLRLKDDQGNITIFGEGGGGTGTSGTSGVSGLSLAAKNIEIDASDFTFSTPDSTATVTFAQPFASTDYSIDVVWLNSNTNRWNDLSTTIGVSIANKTASGFDLIYLNYDIPTNMAGYSAYVTCIALGENSPSGTSGTSGSSGISGSSGSSGISGSSGQSGTSGTSGISGSSGESGTSGTSGISGSSGISGTSGTSGQTGTSGTSGQTGTSGTSGAGATINNNADNRVITGSNTAGTLNGETNFTFDGSQATINTYRVNEAQLSVEGQSDGSARLRVYKNGTNAARNQPEILMGAEGATADTLIRGNRIGGVTIANGPSTFNNVRISSGNVTSNVFVGGTAGNANTTGSNLVFIGTEAGEANTTGSNNIAIGRQALEASTISSNLIAIGSEALQNINSADIYNTIAIGSKAMENATEQPYDVVAIGTEAAQNAGRSRSVFIGSQAGQNAELNAYYAVNIGHQSGQLAGSYYTTYVGFYAGRSSGGPQNVGIGSEALTQCNGFNNTAVGHASAPGVNANSGVFIGTFAGSGNSTASGNTIIGANVTGAADIEVSVMIGSGDGQKHITSIPSQNNTYIGYQAGTGATGTGNTFLGAGLASATGSNQVLISSGAGIQFKANGTASTEVFNPLIPKKDTETNINAIPSPVSGMIVYNTTDNELNYYNGTSWVASGGGAGTSGTSGISGTSGTSGVSGTSGTSGADGAGVTINNNTDNYVLTASGVANTINGESNLIYDGSNLSINGVKVGPGNSLYNTVVGDISFASNTTGTANTTIGYNSLNANTIGINNSAYGALSLTFNVTGSNNSAYGYLSQYNNTTGSYNNSFGDRSLQDNTFGVENAAFGSGALGDNTTGSYNSAFGNSSLRLATTGEWNVAMGRNALNAVTNGSFNTGIGASCGTNLTTGANNTFVGYNAGDGIQTGSSNTVIGANITGLGSTTANNIIIGDGDGTVRLRFSDTGALSLTGPAVSSSITNTVTNKIAITINGTLYYLLASTSST